MIRNLRALVITFMTAALLSACGGQQNSSDTNNIFGTDDREAITSGDTPWSAIGKLSTGCTGTLIGPRLVLTAAHCIYDDGDWISSNYYFYPNYKNGSYRHSSRVEHVWWGTQDPSTDPRSEDWAILLLEDRLGDTYGWLGSKPYTFGVGDPVSVAGYSYDFRGGQTAGVHRDCNVKNKVRGMVFYDCDTARGSSGGPVLGYFDGDYTVIGVNVAEYRDGGEDTLTVDWYHDDYASVGIPLTPFFSTLKDVYDRYR